MFKYFPEGIKTVQKDIEYTDPSDDDGSSLKNAIKEYLKHEIEKERMRMSKDVVILTPWYDNASVKVERVLDKYDMFCFSAKKSQINYTKSKQKLSIEQKKDQETF